MTGLYGGAFDPPHVGHVALAAGAKRAFALPRLIVLVSERPGHKGTHAPAEASFATSSRGRSRTPFSVSLSSASARVLGIRGSGSSACASTWSGRNACDSSRSSRIRRRPRGSAPAARSTSSSHRMWRRSSASGASTLRPSLDSLAQARRIAALAQEKLAEDVLILDMRSECTFTDYFVIATGRNPRQTAAIWDEVHEKLKQGEQHIPRSVDGVRDGTWILADYLDVVLHVFTPDAREYYKLEELWGDLPAVELDTAASA